MGTIGIKARSCAELPPTIKSNDPGGLTEADKAEVCRERPDRCGEPATTETTVAKKSPWIAPPTDADRTVFKPNGWQQVGCEATARVPDQQKFLPRTVRGHDGCPTDYAWDKQNCMRRLGSSFRPALVP
jgi:hypothetical protein